MKKNSVQATITQVGWDVDLDDEVTPLVCIVLPDETEVVLRDQITNGWAVEKITLGEAVNTPRIQKIVDEDDAFHARYGVNAEFDFDTLRQVRQVLMQKGSDFFKEGYAQPIELRNVKKSALQHHQRRT